MKDREKESRKRAGANGEVLRDCVKETGKEIRSLTDEKTHSRPHTKLKQREMETDTHAKGQRQTQRYRHTPLAPARTYTHTRTVTEHVKLPYRSSFIDQSVDPAKG